MLPESPPRPSTSLRMRLREFTAHPGLDPGPPATLPVSIARDPGSSPGQSEREHARHWRPLLPIPGEGPGMRAPMFRQKHQSRILESILPSPQPLSRNRERGSSLRLYISKLAMSELCPLRRRKRTWASISDDSWRRVEGSNPEPFGPHGFQIRFASMTAPADGGRRWSRSRLSM